MCTTLSFSQSGTWYVGVESGINFIETTDDPKSLDFNKKTIQGGVFGEYFFSESWGVQAKIKLYKVGEVFEDSFFKANQLTIPVVAKKQWGKRFKFNMVFGGFLAFLSNIEATDDYGGQFLKDTSEAGLTLGLGFQYGIIGDKLIAFVDGSAFFGFKNRGYTEGFVSLTNNTINNSQISLGVKFKL